MEDLIEYSSAGLGKNEAIDALREMRENGVSLPFLSERLSISNEIIEKTSSGLHEPSFLMSHEILALRQTY